MNARGEHECDTARPGCVALFAKVVPDFSRHDEVSRKRVKLAECLYGKSVQRIASTAHPLGTTTRRLKSLTTFATEAFSGATEARTFPAEPFSAAQVALSATAEAPSFAVETFSCIAEKRSATAEAQTLATESRTFATEKRTFRAEKRTFRAEKLSGAAETFSASQRSSLSHRDYSPSGLYAKTAPHA